VDPTARTCALCGRSARTIAGALGVCGPCIRARPGDALPRAERAHAESRRAFGLPETPPRTPGGVACPLCRRSCRMGDGERGYCGLRTARRGRIVHLAGTPRRGLIEWYRDPLPTNCVADWVCAGRRRPGDHNLAVFYASCSSDCLFCQNWHFRTASPGEDGLSAAALAAVANPRTFCVCFFGGDPAPQMPTRSPRAPPWLRGAWPSAGRRPALPTPGSSIARWTSPWRAAAASSSTSRPGTTACTGPSRACPMSRRSRASPGLRAAPVSAPIRRSSWPARSSSGYVDAEEVARLAAFIAAIDPGIPYALLGFAPHFAMGDLPRTSRRHAEEALAGARAAG